MYFFGNSFVCFIPVYTLHFVDGSCLGTSPDLPYIRPGLASFSPLSFSLLFFSLSAGLGKRSVPMFSFPSSIQVNGFYCICIGRADISLV